MTRLNRQWLTLRLLDDLQPARFFEVGFGAGDMMIALAERGLQGYGIELADDVVEAFRRRIEGRGLSDTLRVEQGDLLRLTDEPAFDLAIAFEVLEHLQDDLGALAALRRLLKPRGHFLMSVPAQMRQWGPSDVWAGHVRRYEREELYKKLEDAGFIVERFLSLGFPLLRMTRGFRNMFYRNDVERDETMEERTMSSGVKRPPIGRLLRFVIPAFSWVDYQLQRPFLNSDMGESYFVLARRED